MMELPAEFRPEISSRRGEITAWGLAALAFAGWAALSARGLPAGWVYILLAFFLVLSGLAISLTNFVERRTVLRLDTNGVIFENGLRHVQMRWNDILRIQAEPGNLGTFVRVFGAERSYFSFRTLGEVRLRGQTRGLVGFSMGEQILVTMVEKSGLKRAAAPASGSRAPADTYYYARE